MTGEPDIISCFTACSRQSLHASSFFGSIGSRSSQLQASIKTRPQLERRRPPGRRRGVPAGVAPPYVTASPRSTHVEGGGGSAAMFQKQVAPAASAVAPPQQWQEPSIVPSGVVEPGHAPPGSTPGQLPKVPDLPVSLTFKCCGRQLTAAQAKQLLAALVLAALTMIVVLVATVVSILGRVPADKANTGLPVSGLSGGVGHRRSCAQQPCQHGGVCAEDAGCSGGFACDCTGTGFVGETCDVELNACYSFPCAHGGACVDHMHSDGYACQCAPGWGGENCAEEADECLSMPCRNSGRCVDEQGTYSCRCPSGAPPAITYTGHDCEQVAARSCEDWENFCRSKVECQPSSAAAPGVSCVGWSTEADPGTQATCEAIPDCQYMPESAGSCIGLGPGQRACECDPGWSGATCSTRSNLCQPNPCSNGAHCVDRINSFECLCTPGFAGPACTEDVDECASAPCCGRGTIACRDGADSYACECASGYGGVNCANDIDECAPNPCLHGGICDDSHTQDFIAPGYYHCSCAIGSTGQRWSGTNCDTVPADCPPGLDGPGCTTDVDECASTPCQHGATCLESSMHGPVATGFYQCECAVGWHGVNCNSNVDECDSHPCINGATCTDVPLRATFACQCVSGFGGRECQENIHECDSSPCANGGTCIDRDDSFLCDCPPSFDGDTCEISLVIEHCADGGRSPCQNGGTCHTKHGGVVCSCPSGFSGHTCGHSTDIGWGTTVDLTRLYLGDGEFSLNFRPIFSDAAQDQITRDETRVSDPPTTNVFNDEVEMMDAMVEAVGLDYENGMLSSDIWIASKRQHSFTARPTAHHAGQSTTSYTTYTDTYSSAMPLHPDFLQDVAELPASLNAADGMAAYERFLDEFGTHYVRKKIYGGDMKLNFFVSADEVSAAGGSGAVAVAANGYFSSLIAPGQPINAAADNGQHYATVLSRSVRLDSLDFEVRGGMVTEGDYDAWKRSVVQDPAMVGVELAEISDLIADGTKRGNVHSAVAARLRACFHPGGGAQPVCGGRGICEPASSVCLCDVGFYPEQLDTAVLPCSREACPFFSNVECGGRGSCDSNSGTCHCNLDPTYHIAMYGGDDCSADIDECADMSNPCVIGERSCVNQVGSFHCGGCIQGYAEDRHQLCADVDECATDNGGCLGLPCVNEPGSFRCGTCDEGHRPSTTSGHDECEDIDECAENNNVCVAIFEGLRQCVNSAGTYTCGDCLPGYEEDASSGFCIDVDECQVPARLYCGSTDPGFAWVDAAGGGGTADMIRPGEEFAVDLPFRFPFFDDLFQHVKISVDGYISFADGSLPYPNTDPIPTALPPNNILAPYWTDLNIGSCGSLGDGGVWTLADGTGPTARFVIEWRAVHSSVDCSAAVSVDDVLSFELILTPRGGITFQYQSLPTSVDGGSATTPTIGAENEDGSTGWQYGRGWSARASAAVGTLPTSGAAVSLDICDEYLTPMDADDAAWTYRCVDHADCGNTLGGFNCTCQEGYTEGGESVCGASPCRIGQEVMNSNRMGGNRCVGNTGDACDFTCTGDNLPFGEHTCDADGVFRGGLCISECHTLRLDGDCFEGYNGLYIIQTDEMRGQPHYVKQDFEPGDKDLHWSGSSWDIGGLHGRCGQQDCLAPLQGGAGGSEVERMFGMQVQTRLSPQFDFQGRV